MPKSAIVFIVAALFLWGVVVASVWLDVNLHLLLIAGPGGAACCVLAGMRWTDASRPDRDKDALVRAIADISSRRTAPLRRIV